MSSRARAAKSPFAPLVLWWYQMQSKYETFDRFRLLIKPLGERVHDMNLDYLLPLEGAAPDFSHPQLRQVAQRMIAARQNGAARILMMGEDRKSVV